MKLNEKLRHIRKTKNFTQEYVALKINVSRKTISSWENNRSVPDINVLKKLANVYEVPVSELAGENLSHDQSSTKVLIILYYLNAIFVILSILSTIFSFFNFCFHIEIIIMVTFIMTYIYKYKEFKFSKQFPFTILIILIVLLTVLQTNKLNNHGYTIDLFTIIGAAMKAILISYGFRIILMINKIKEMSHSNISSVNRQ